MVSQLIMEDLRNMVEMNGNGTVLLNDQFFHKSLTDSFFCRITVQDRLHLALKTAAEIRIVILGRGRVCLNLIPELIDSIVILVFHRNKFLLTD